MKLQQIFQIGGHRGALKVVTIVKYYIVHVMYLLSNSSYIVVLAQAKNPWNNVTCALTECMCSAAALLFGYLFKIFKDRKNEFKT